MAFLIVACDEAVVEPEPVVIRPATVAELTGPWRPTPLGLDVAMRTRVEQACRRDVQMPLGSVAAVIDARGASVVTVRMTGENPGSCDALQVMANGQVAGAGSGRRAEDRERLPMLGPSELGPIENGTIAGGDLKTEGWSVTGRAGVGITLVVVEPLNHMAVVATFENGWFGAWWPARPGEPPRDGLRFPPFVIRAYDAFGVLQDEVSK